MHEVVLQTAQIYKAYRPCLLLPEVQSIHYRLSLYLYFLTFKGLRKVNVTRFKYKLKDLSALG